MACKCSPEQRDDSNKKYKETSGIPLFDPHVYNPCDASNYDSSYNINPSIICELMERIKSLENRVSRLESRHTLFA